MRIKQKLFEPFSRLLAETALSCRSHPFVADGEVNKEVFAALSIQRFYPKKLVLGSSSVIN